jgi:hypothetical protein
VRFVAAGEQGHAQADDQEAGDGDGDEPLLGRFLADRAALLVHHIAGRTAVVAPDVDAEGTELLGSRAHRQDGGTDDCQDPEADQ